MTKHYKILELRAENIKRLSVVQIRPSGKLVQITGKNGQGKTSVLDAIWWAIAGAQNIQDRPINDHADEALIRLDMGELKITRRFRKKEGEEPPYTTSLVVEAADGSRFPSPQTMLDSLIGQLSFDPLAFTRLKPKDQFDALKPLVADYDFDKAEADNKRDYADRTDANRRAKELKAQAAGIMVTAETVATVDVSALVAELERAADHNNAIERRRQKRAQAEADITKDFAVADRADEQIARLEASIKVMRADAEAARGRAQALKKRLDEAGALPDSIDTEELKARIAKAQETNELARKAGEKLALARKAKAYEEEAAALTAAMQAREEHKRAAIAQAALPVEGLGFGEEELVLNGHPFVQASDAEQLRASIAIAISMNPQIRVIRVRDGSLLDEDSIKLVAELAEAHDCQVWLERVDSSGKIGFVLEDGHVKEAEQ